MPTEEKRESVKSINKSASSSGHTTEQKPVYDFFKLDELPQLFNILKGDISIVGLRPVMEVETEIYGNYRDMLLSVKPGLTGFRAANGRSCTSYACRRAMEICYIKNRSVCFDLKIILKTITSVFKGEGAV
nr:sugar transferase [Ruminococcus bromii]